MVTDKALYSGQISVIVNGQAWKEVGSFEDYDSDDGVFALDRITGRVSFGDGAHGRKLPVGSRVEATYRTGDGSAGNTLSFAWTITGSDSPIASIATITTLPNSFRLSFHHGMENSWRWKFVNWLCDVLKKSLLSKALFSRK